MHSLRQEIFERTELSSPLAQCNKHLRNKRSITRVVCEAAASVTDKIRHFVSKDSSALVATQVLPHTGAGRVSRSFLNLFAGKVHPEQGDWKMDLIVSGRNGGVSPEGNGHI